MKFRGYSFRGALAVVVSISAALLVGCDRSQRDTAPVATSEPSTRPSLPHTQVVATLDTLIEPGNNAVWCCSFVAAWKELQNDLAKGVLEFAGPSQLWKSLNASADPTKDVPEGAMYAVAGTTREGIDRTIREEVARRFPGSKLPVLPSSRDADFIAYARLQVSAKFPRPYFDIKHPVTWTGGSGKTSEIRTFGAEYESGAFGPRSQATILYYDMDLSHQTTDSARRLLEWVVDINDRSQPVEIIVAQIPRQPTLQRAVSRVGELIEQFKRNLGEPDRPDALGPDDVLRVPEMAWTLSHSFPELQGQSITAGPLRGDRLVEARQDIEFRLNRGGAELKSESLASGVGGGPKTFEVFRPFLVMLKLRTAAQPFLAVWVENDEPLRPYAVPATNPG